MRAKRLQTRQQNDDASATKKCRSKSLSVKRNASSSRDTSPPKSVRRVQDKVDSEKKTPTKKLMTKTKKEITSTESKPGNKDETKESQQHMVPQSGIDSLKSNKKTTKNIVDEQKKKDSLKASSGKLKLPTKKETTKQGIKKPDDRVKCNKDEKVSKELKNLGIQISDQSPSSNDKIIKASISEIVKTKYRTSASHSLYGKTPIGIEKATSSKTIECTKENIKDTVIKVESNNTADEKKETKTEVKDDKDVKAIRPVKKESTKETKKEEASDFDAANASEKKQQPAKNKKVGTEHKDLATKFDSKTKEDKKEFSVTKSNCQDISKDKKLKKNDSSEQKKKTKKVENEAEQPSHSSIKEDSKKAKSPKVTKSKKETEDNLDKSSKIKEIKAINQIVEKVNVVQPNDLNTVDINDESKKSITSTENKTQTSKKSKSDENVKKSQNDFNSSSSKKFEDDVDKKAAKKDNNDFKNIDTESNSKLPKKKSKSPKKSASGGTESKDTKESKESSLASIVQTIEEVIAQAVYESVLMEQFKVDSEKHVKSKPSKIPKIKKTENVKTNENPVKRKYVKKKIKVEGHETQETISKPNEQEEPKIEPSAISKPIDKKENEKVNPKKKSAIPKKKGKLTLNEPRKTEGDDKLECRTSSSTKNQSKSATDVITKQSTSETSNKAKETIDNSAVKTKTNLLADEPTTSNKFTDDTIPVKESSDSQLKLTEITIYETEKNQLNSKIAPANISYNLEHIDEGTTSERIDNISSFIESPKFISEDSDDDEDFFINLPANLTSATFSGLNIDKPIKEANQSGAKVPTNVQIQPASNNIDDDSNESSTASSDESIVDKRRKKKPVKQSMAKKKAAEKAAKKNTVIGKPAKTSKASMKSQAKELAEKPDPLPMKSKISVKSLESMKNPTVEEKQIKVEILSDDEECCRILENVMNQPSTSSSQIPKNPPSKEPPTKRKYVRKKPLKSDQNKNKNDDNNDATKKDVYDFHESGHSSEDTCLSYKKNSKNDKDSEKKKSERIDRPASSKKVTLVKKKVLSKKDDQTDDEQKMRTTKNDQRTKPSKTPKAKSTQQKRKSSLNHSGSSDSDSDDKVLSKKFSKKKKIFSDSASRSSSVSESSDSEHEVTSSGGKNPRKKLIDSFIGPKRHRIASLNALAKVQCLYENESRTAQELGFVKEPRTLPKEKPIVLLTSEEDNEKIKSESLGQSAPTKKDKEVKKEKKSTQEQPENKNEKQPKQPKQRDKNEDENDEEQEEEEEVVIRTLRAAPGLRGAGKLWEVSMSSMESNSDVDSDESYEDNKADKTKSKKKPLPKRTSVKSSQKTPIVKSKSKTVKAKASTKRLLSSCNSDSSEDESEPTPSSSKKHSKKKRKKSPHDGKSDFKELVVRKRMASLNASAMLAATYEVERHLDRCDSMYYGSSAESDTIVTPKKIKDIKREIEEPKEPRPVSTNVVIVKDTDVTITGVYVNSSLGSSQEAYCKMQYRVQSSVTEERLLRPTTQDPPKSYTPLSALSCMLPPGSADSIGIETQPSTLQHQPQYHHGPPHQIPLSHHLQSHHQSPDCETPSPFRYQNVYQQSPPSQMQSSSAFCAIPQPDATGYYQPAGPLISSHLVPQSQPVSTKAGSSGLDGDTVQSSSTPGSDSTDREILITGGTPRPQTFHYPPQGHGPYQRPIHQMHCPTYPPANYYASYGQHPQDMCYSPPYQTYYPQKVYPSSYRRYVTPSGTYYQPAPNEMYEAPPASAQPQQPPSSQQIVPTGPQHIEHYPPFYSGYSPGGGPGGCYNRSMQPPYIDSSPYPNSCPCPMQSCPKNVHTGPLIGSKTGKGPVQSNHLVAPIDTATSVTLSSNSTSVNQKINCKTEDVSSPPPVVMVKPEGDTHLHLHTMPVSDVTKSPVRDKVYEKIGHAPPNFALNIKALEPEMSLSPARGSTGLLPSVQASATQPADNAPTVRKTRVGKTMAREMVMIPQQRQVLNLHVDKKSNPRLVAEHTDIIMEVKDATPLIKKENVRIEYEDDDVFILDSRKCETPTKVINDHMSCLNCDESMSSADDVNICNKRRSTESDVITLDDSIEESPPSSTVKKRKILELHKNPCKKSPPNSYKSLIKQSDPRSYLFKADVAEKDVPRGRSRYRLIRGRASPRYRQSEIIINGKHKKVLITNRKVKRRIIKKHVTKKLIPKTKVVQTDVMEVQVNEVVKLKSKDVAQESTEEKTEEKRLFMSSLELTVDGVAKGYVSDQEILAKSKLNSKTKCTESHSKSETQKPLIVESIESNVKMRDRSKSATKTAAESKSEPKTAKGKAKDDKASKNAKKATLSLVSDEMLMDDHSINNNNTILLDNNYGKLQRAISTKKTKSRGAKFSNKKRHRVRQLQEIEDIEIPRKSTAAPRWSNGWHWEGNPFKGKVFLNSDDVQVIRTRYPAMRHDSGDIIEPGDCVLLRAGGKKNELPYVAKVASLWENPEDGEMMMSLLWYYRPEHTEQGRQIHDCPDEVFASKHQDHNSVACIEDKCYVLTFNEYCRYRKALKAMEEDIILPKPIAPCMCFKEDRVPVNTNSELVLFCRRVYEFRLKRLIKNPS